MAENNGLYSIQGSTLTDIADAIREKNGSTQQYTPSEMATAVLAIKGGEGGGGIVELPSTLTYWSENENIEFGDISTPADTVKMASGKTLESVLAGCWIEFADKDGNPTDEPYIHWYVEVPDVVLITFTISNTSYQAEEGMTWSEWVNSEYNTDEFYLADNGYIRDNGIRSIRDKDGNANVGSKPIEANGTYRLAMDEPQ